VRLAFLHPFADDPDVALDFRPGGEARFAKPGRRQDRESERSRRRRVEGGEVVHERRQIGPRHRIKVLGLGGRRQQLAHGGASRRIIAGEPAARLGEVDDAGDLGPDLARGRSAVPLRQRHANGVGVDLGKRQLGEVEVLEPAVRTGFGTLDAALPSARPRVEVGEEGVAERLAVRGPGGRRGAILPPAGYANAIVGLYVGTALLGAVVYLYFKVDIQPSLERDRHWHALGFFDLKEDFVAIGLGLLPVYWISWRRPFADERVQTASALTTIIGFIVWWSFLVGHVVNDITGFGS
jgi:hypothetical protein